MYTRGMELTLETGLLTLANSYVAGVPWGLFRRWRGAGVGWDRLTALAPIS
jgi:hypothetical protein